MTRPEQYGGVFDARRGRARFPGGLPDTPGGWSAVTAPPGGVVPGDDPGPVHRRRRAGATSGHHRPPQGRRRLTQRVGGGIGRVFLDAVSARSGTLVIGLVLARMLSPREFGAFGVVVVALLGAQSIGQLGAGSALTLWRTAPEDVAPTVTTVALASSVAVYAGVYAGAPALAATMGTPGAAQVIRWVTL